MEKKDFQRGSHKMLRRGMRVTSFLLFVIIMSSCSRTSSETWEDVKTAGRYFKKSLNSLWGGEYESKEVASNDEFLGPSDDFIPLNEEDLHSQRKVSTKPTKKRSKRTTSDRSGVNLAQFGRPPSKFQEIFRTIHFTTDDHVVRERKDLVTVARIANFMKKHKNSYLMVEGHCDKRASAEYNMALGMRRAHHIRVLLAKQGVDSSRIYTISYGKEKPIAFGDQPQDFMQNRRAQFKLKVQ